MKFDMNKMLQEAQRMQAELAKAQEEAASEVVEASAGGGMVTVKANGAGEVVEIRDRPACDRPRRSRAPRGHGSRRRERGAPLGARA